MHRLLLALLLGLAGQALAAEPGENREISVAEVQAADFATLQELQARLRRTSQAEPESFAAQLAAAEGYLAGANRLRNERKIVSKMPADQDAEYRAQQASWAEAALPLAERALALAKTDAERAQAERVLGELHAHRITGMVSGMINGPRARGHIHRALELEPDDPECQRAIGLMYLNNPPISGGDVPKAIETFSRCASQLPDERCLVLLSMAYRKHGEPERAREAARQALARNPESPEAKLLLAELP
jgi:tetratricopeptide (TPR) repeat protein